MASSFSDEEIVAFAQRWDPYGGPAPSEIFLHFGCPVDIYQDRLGAALETIVDVDAARHARMREYTRRPHVIDETRWTPH